MWNFYLALESREKVLDYPRSDCLSPNNPKIVCDVRYSKIHILYKREASLSQTPLRKSLRMSFYVLKLAHLKKRRKSWFLKSRDSVYFEDRFCIVSENLLLVAIQTLGAIYYFGTISMRVSPTSFKTMFSWVASTISPEPVLPFSWNCDIFSPHILFSSTP